MSDEPEQVKSAAEISESILRDALKEAADFLEAIATCHICKGALYLNETAPHCEDCSSDCDEHDEPSCPSIAKLHEKVLATVHKVLK